MLALKQVDDGIVVRFRNKPTVDFKIVRSVYGGAFNDVRVLDVVSDGEYRSESPVPEPLVSVSIVVLRYLIVTTPTSNPISHPLHRV